MANVTKEFLSASNGGQPIQIDGYSVGANTLLHTADSTATDEVWLYAVNNNSSTTNLTVEFGAPGDAELIKVGLSSQNGLVLICPGNILTSSLPVKAYADVADQINIVGWVNRIT